MIDRGRTGDGAGVPGQHGERGSALAVAVFALALIGALVGINFFAGRLEQQSGQNTLFAHQAREAAEAGLSDAMARVEAGTLAPLPPGAVLGMDTITLGRGASASRDVVRLTSGLFLIRSRGLRRGADGAVLATRALGAVVHVLPATAQADTATEETAAGARITERGWVQLY